MLGKDTDKVQLLPKRDTVLKEKISARFLPKSSKNVKLDILGRVNRRMEGQWDITPLLSLLC